MSDREDEIQGAYEQGERDGAASKDDSDPLEGVVHGLTLGLFSSSSYNPPSDPEEKEAYNKGFENASS